MYIVDCEYIKRNMGIQQRKRGSKQFNKQKICNA